MYQALYWVSPVQLGSLNGWSGDNNRFVVFPRCDPAVLTSGPLRLWLFQWQDGGRQFCSTVHCIALCIWEVLQNPPSTPSPIVLLARPATINNIPTGMQIFLWTRSMVSKVTHHTLIKWHHLFVFVSWYILVHTILSCSFQFLKRTHCFKCPVQQSSRHINGSSTKWLRKVWG